MKLSVSTYSYSNVFGQNGFDTEKLFETIKNQGFEGIEFANVPFTNENFNSQDDIKTNEVRLAYAHKLNQMCVQSGLTPVNYCVGADFINCGDIEAEIKRVCAEVDIAAALGVKSIRHDATYGPNAGAPLPKSFNAFLEPLAYAYGKVTQYAKKKGIVTLVENHGYFCQDSVRVEKLINAVADENFGALIDVGNFLCADENPVYAVGLLLPYAKHIHIKDFHVKSGMLPDPGEGFFRSRGGNYLRGSIIGHGDAPVYQCIRKIQSYGYDGWLSVEFEGLENAVTGTSIGLKNIKSYL